MIEIKSSPNHICSLSQDTTNIQLTLKIQKVNC